ncbi:MAG: hypothetical protein ACLP7F_20570 [Acidimicrobiales bacterium]
MSHSQELGRARRREGDHVSTSAMLEVELQAMDSDGEPRGFKRQPVAGLDSLSQGIWTVTTLTCVAPASARMILASAVIY